MAELRRLKEKIRSEEEQINRQIMEAKDNLSSSSEDETGKIQSRFSMLTSKLKNFKKRNAEEIKKLKRELGQLKRKVRQLKVG